MNTQMIIQTLVGDVIFSVIISAVFVFVSNRTSQQEKQQIEREMLFLKEHTQLKFEGLERKIDSLKDILLENSKAGETLNFLQLLKETEKEPPSNGSSK